MNYEKEHTYIVSNNVPLIVRTKADDIGLEVTTLSPGHSVYCKSFTVDNNNDIWIRTKVGWVRATFGTKILIS